MHRIDTATKATDLFGSGKHGFQDGTAPGVGSTRLDAAFFNSLQEEPANIVEFAGGTLDKTNRSQLAEFIFSWLEQMALTSFQALVTGTSETLNDVAVGDDTGGGDRSVVAVGENAAIIRSASGTGAFTQPTAGSGFTDDFNGVAYDPLGFAAVGAAGEIQTSPTGATWTQRVTGLAAAFKAVTNNFPTKGTFVAVGESGLIYSSTALATWTSRTSAAGSATMNDVCFGAGLFVAVGASGNIQTSPTGVTWTSRASGIGTDLESVRYSSDWSLFVAIASTGVILTSPDGITWTSLSNPFGGNYRLPVLLRCGLALFQASALGAVRLARVHGTTIDTSAGSAPTLYFSLPAVLRKARFISQPQVQALSTGAVGGRVYATGASGMLCISPYVR